MPPSTHPAPAFLTKAAPGGTQDLSAPTPTHLGLGDAFQFGIPDRNRRRRRPEPRLGLALEPRPAPPTRGEPRAGCPGRCSSSRSGRRSRLAQRTLWATGHGELPRRPFPRIERVAGTWVGGGGHRPRPYFPTHICCHSDDAELAAPDFSITPSGRLPALSGSAGADRLVVGAEVLRLASFCLVDNA